MGYEREFVHHGAALGDKFNEAMCLLFFGIESCKCLAGFLCRRMEGLPPGPEHLRSYCIAAVRAALFLALNRLTRRGCWSHIAVQLGGLTALREFRLCRGSLLFDGEKERSFFGWEVDLRPVNTRASYRRRSRGSGSMVWTGCAFSTSADWRGPPPATSTPASTTWTRWCSGPMSSPAR